MVRAVLVASRYPGQPNRLDAYRDALNRKLAGDNIEPRPPAFVRHAGLSAALLNPSDAARMHGASIAIGTLLEPRDDWHVPGAPLPDGSFALLRADDAHVELAADSVGSRTLWYALTDHELIASSSQRAIVTLLGSFEPNRDALPWMLSSGTLGPTAAWDARLHRAPARRARAARPRALAPRVADRSPSRSPPTTPRRTTRSSSACAPPSQDACRRWSFDATQVGADVVRRRGQPQPPVPAARPRDRDRHVGPAGEHRAGRQRRAGRSPARRTRSACRIDSFPIDSRASAPEVVLERFLAAGEGRVARISGYVDGFHIWKTLFDEGYDGVIRGDEAFGSIPVSSPYDARCTASLTTLADFFSAEERETFELPEQPLPERLARGRRRDARDLARPALSAVSRADALGRADRSEDGVCRGRQSAALALGARVRAALTRRAAHGEAALARSRRRPAARRGARDSRRDSVVDGLRGRPPRADAVDRRADFRAREFRIRAVAARARAAPRCAPSCEPRSTRREPAARLGAGMHCRARSRRACAPLSATGGSCAPRSSRSCWRFAPSSPRACTRCCARTPRRNRPASNRRSTHDRAECRRSDSSRWWQDG